MKKKIFIGLFFLFAQSQLIAQINDYAVGIRLSPYSGRINPMLSYQKGISKSTRIDIGLFLFGRQSGVDKLLRGNASFYYQHVWNITGGLNWYLGAGVRYDFSRLKVGTDIHYNDYFGGGPQIGLEYDFTKHNFPIVIGLDYSPTVGIYQTPPYSFAVQHNLGLSLKYTINEKKSKRTQKGFR